jgi:uncharacterized membrane protein
LTTAYAGIFPYLVSSPRPLHKNFRIIPGFARSGWGVKHLLSQTGCNPKGATVPENTPQTGLTDEVAGGLAYFTFIPAIIFLVVAPYNQKASIRFHCWQSILLTAAAIVIDIALAIILGIVAFIIPWYLIGPVWWLIRLAWLIIWLLPVVNAFQGKRFKLPIIGNFAEKQAGV